MVKVLSSNLKVARIKAGLFQKDVAKRANISSNAYAQIEAGRRSTTGKTAKNICDCLGVDFDGVFEIRTRERDN